MVTETLFYISLGVLGLLLVWGIWLLATEHGYNKDMQKLYAEFWIGFSLIHMIIFCTLCYRALHG